MDMPVTLLRSLLALVPVCILFAGALILFIRARTGVTTLQLVGASGLVVVVLTHVCEALHFLAWMQWGREGSVGHYLDLSFAIIGLTLFPLGFLLHALGYDRRK